MFISTLLPILAWISISWTLSQRIKRGFATALLVTACAIILALFMGLILGALQLSYYLIILGAFLHAIFRGWTVHDVKRALSTEKLNFRSFKDSYAVLYLCAVIISYLFARKVYPDFVFFGWDEFSHWARYTKILIDTSSAPIDNPSVLFPEYPPGINLWHYFICGPEGYSEWKVVFSQMLLVIAGITFVSTNFGAVKGLGTVAIFAFGLMLYHAFGTSLYEIYTDCVLGLLFASALIIVGNIATKDTDRWSMVSLFLVLATISLIKPIAILFAITACGLFFWLRLTNFSVSALQKFVNRSKESSSTPEKNISKKPFNFFHSVVQTLQLLLASFSTVFIWKLYTSANSVKAQLADSQQVGLSEVIEFLFTRDTKETQIAWKELGDRIGFDRVSSFGGKQFRLDSGFFTAEAPIYHGAIALLLATMALLLLRIIFNHKKSVKIIAESLYLAGTFLIYMFIIVFITRYFFQLYDIERLASLERYLSSFLLGILLYGFATLITDISNVKAHSHQSRTGPNLQETKLKKPNINMLSMSLPILWIGVAFYTVFMAPVDLDNVFAKPLNERPVPRVHPWVDEYVELHEIRDQIATLSNIVKTSAEPTDKVFVIAQNESGFTFYMTGHQLSPLETNKSCFSVGEKYAPTDNWTCEWVDLSVSLLEYQYLVIRYADKAFWDRFGNLFESSAVGAKAGVFKVDKDAENKIRLNAIYLSNEVRGPD